MRAAFLDGNAVAGTLDELFAVEATELVGECAGCGRRGPLAETLVFVGGPGIVVRCRGCEGVVLRVAALPGRTVVDLGGLRSLEARTP